MMERLTQWYGSSRLGREVGAATHLQEKYTEEELVDVLAKRLAAYEDTGLEPEEIAEYQRVPKGYVLMKNELWRELEQLRQAKTEGRFVILPCKVGDAIWRIKCNGAWPDFGTPYVEADAFLYRDIHYFGKTVFLTREEAEAALRGGADHE